MKKCQSSLWISVLALPLLGGCTGAEIIGGVFGVGVGAHTVSALFPPGEEVRRERPQPFSNSKPKPVNPPVAPNSVSSPIESGKPCLNYAQLRAWSELANAIQVYEDGEYEWALKTFQALETNPFLEPEDRAKTAVYRAICELMCGKPETARGTYRLALECNPELRRAPWMSAFSPEQLALLHY